MEFICPHCKGTIIVDEINCGIFRHGAWKKTGQQIPPHASKEDCEKWSENAWGCCKPFQIVKENNVWIIRVCEYI